MSPRSHPSRGADCGEHRDQHQLPDWRSRRASRRRTLTLEFERIDEGSIGVSARSGDRSIALKITRLGIISRM
jgi:hypothetical protein